MIELPGWNDLISVNGFCYSSSMGESPKLNIPLKTSTAPTKGIAPATFVRNSTATYIDNDGILQTAGINVPRFQNGRYLCEPAGTNMLAYSELLTNAWWSGINITITEDIAKESFKLTNTTTGSCYTRGQLISVSSGVYYTQSAVLEKGNTDFASMAFASSVNSLLSYAVFNLDIGVVVKAENCTATIKEYVAGKYRCRVTLVSEITSSSIVSGYITPCREESTRLQGVLGDYIYATKVQTEVGQQVTSYIKTEAAPMGRVADVLYYDISSVITQGQGSVYYEFWGCNVPGPIRRILNISDGTNNNQIYLYVNTTGSVSAIAVYNGVTQTAIPAYAILPTLNKGLLTYKDNEVILYCNGTKRGEDLSCTIPTNFTKLSAGCSHDGTLQLNSELGNIKYFKEVLTPAEAFKLTTV